MEVKKHLALAKQAYVKQQAHQESYQESFVKLSVRATLLHASEMKDKSQEKLKKPP